MRRFIASFLSIILSLNCLSAQEGSIRVEAQSLVAVGEQFNVTVTINAPEAPQKPDWNPGEDFQVVWGPQRVGSSSSVSIVNGKKTSSIQHTYVYILRTDKKGVFTLPPVSMNIGGETIRSNTPTIEVVTDSGSGGNTGDKSSQQAQTAQGRGESTPQADAFLRFVISKNKVVVGEPITATLKLFTRADVVGFQDVKLPTFNGFWSQETYAPSNIEFKRESVGDKIYLSAVLREYSLIPQQTGNIVIDPAEIVCVMRVRDENAGMGSIFDSFFEDMYKEVRKKAVSAGYTVNVSPLPSGAPESFAGGVGSFNISAGVSRDTLKMHEAGSLKITISGKGNVSLIEAPKIKFPGDFDSYDVKTSENADAGRTSGSRTFEYPFIPRSYGDYTLGPVEYTYYDYQARRYVTKTTGPINVHVLKSEAPESSGEGTVYVSNRKGVRDLGNDIRHISIKNPDLFVKGSFFALSVSFYMIAALILAAGAVFYSFARRRMARKADVAGTRNRAAMKMAARRLSSAGKFLEAGLHTEFYLELHRALLGFASDKLSMDVAQLSKENISENLKEKGVSAELADEFVGLIDDCECERYSPVKGHDAMNAHYKKALGLISSVDAGMKRTRKTAGTALTLTALLLMLAPLQANAGTPAADSLWTSGVDAYQNAEWTVALDKWQQIENSGLESAELYYNIGNAYFKGGYNAKAILYYERALKLDPSYSDARYNLQFVNELTQDQIDSVPEFFLAGWMRKFCWLFPADAWAVLCLFFLAAAVLLVLLFLLSGKPVVRKLGFGGGIAALALTILCLSFSIWQKKDCLAQDGAIVTVPVASVSSSPVGDAKDLFVLHEGTRVDILESVGSWTKIGIADGREGWIKTENIEII